MKLVNSITTSENSVIGYNLYLSREEVETILSAIDMYVGDVRARESNVGEVSQEEHKYKNTCISLRAEFSGLPKVE